MFIILILQAIVKIVKMCLANFTHFGYNIIEFTLYAKAQQIGALNAKNQSIEAKNAAELAAKSVDRRFECKILDDLERDARNAAIDASASKKWSNKLNVILSDIMKATQICEAHGGQAAPAYVEMISSLRKTRNVANTERKKVRAAVRAAKRAQATERDAERAAELVKRDTERVLLSAVVIM